MDYESYQRAFFIAPAPRPRFPMLTLGGVSLYFARYDEAVAFYTNVLGPPAYAEGTGTTGWPIGAAWLTLFKADAGDPANVDLTITLPTGDEVAPLYQAFIDAGATGDPPSAQFLYEPVRYAAVMDPFGTTIVIISRLTQE